MKIVLTAVILSTFVAVAAQAEDKAPQSASQTTTAEWLAQPSKDTIANVEPASGGESVGTGNPLLDRKLESFKR